jgi:hypothetical protein
MSEFPTTHGFVSQPEVVKYLLDAYGTPAQIDAYLHTAADRLVRALGFPIIP